MNPLADVSLHPVTLLHFWSFTCPKSLATLPYLKRWQELYGPHGLSLIGIHSPQFRFASQDTGLNDVVRELEINWHNLNDRDRQLAAQWHTDSVPRMIVVASSGTVVFDQIGATGYQVIEAAIRDQLNQRSHALLPPKTMVDLSHRSARHVCVPSTPTMYAGYERGVYKNSDPVTRDFPHGYQDALDPSQPGLTLTGTWQVEAERIRTVDDTQPDASLLWTLAGTGIDCVASSLNDGPAQAYITLAGQPLTTKVRGSSVVINDDGTTVVQLAKPGLYQLIRPGDYLAPGQVELRPKAGQWAVYAVSPRDCGTLH